MAFFSRQQTDFRTMMLKKNGGKREQWNFGDNFHLIVFADGYLTQDFNAQESWHWWIAL